MKNRKLVVAFIMALAMVFSACGGEVSPLVGK